MRPAELLKSLQASFKDSKTRKIIIGDAEVRRWPEGIFAEFEKGQYLTPAEPATMLECPGCEEACFMHVHIQQHRNDSNQSIAFIACLERDDVGRVRVDFADLRRWQMTRASFEKIESQFVLSADSDNETLKKTKAPPAFRAAFLALLAEIEKRAKAQGIPFNRMFMAARKTDLQAVAEKWNDALDGLSERTFDDYIQGLCAFQRGRKTDTDFYRHLFPEWFRDS